jgi:hypothetical protein
MPQISKIRIVNFYYNDGNRFIPDELYDLTSASGDALSSLFQLINAGGKTVMVQLIMQPVNPRAMAGGRHIEDYFVNQGAHSFVVLEWTTDGSREKLLTGIAMAASTSNSSDDNKRGNSIKYYTFKTVYDRSSPYDIAALELSKNEGGRYVPLPFEYVREKAKASKGALEYYSSDDSVKWTEELSHYGILRSEWETVIETLNKDEGGLDKYFDEAKTSDKLISKFFIPAIEQKMKKGANSMADSSLETMLINYAKKIADKESVIQERDTNKRLLATLTELNDMSDQLYSKNDEYIACISEACGFKTAVTKGISFYESEMIRLDSEIEKQKELIKHINYEEKSKAYYVASDNYEQQAAQYNEAKEKLEKNREEFNRLKHEEDLLQCAKLYKKIKEYNGEADALKSMIEEKENDSQDAERIAMLKYSVLLKAQEEAAILDRKNQEIINDLTDKNAELEKAKADNKRQEEIFEAANRKYIETETVLVETKKATDRLVEKLAMDVNRQFDGFYHKDELEGKRENRLKEQKQLSGDLEQLQTLLDKLEKRRTKLPEEHADLKIEIANEETRKNQALSELGTFEKLYEKLVKICTKFSFDETSIYTDQLKRAVKDEYESTQARINKLSQYKKDLDEKLAAVKNGYLHILPQIIKYAESTGVIYRTCEEYLCSAIDEKNITREAAEKLLDTYPEVAYSILFDNKSEINRFLAAGNLEWLPAIVPLLTMEQFDLILKGEMEHTDFLAVCDKGYFSNRTDYSKKIENEIKDLENKIEQKRQYLADCEKEKKLVEQFDYSDSWKREQDVFIEKIENSIREMREKQSELERESVKLQAEYDENKEQFKSYDENLRNINHWLDLFAELSMRMEDEISEYNKEQEAFISCNNADKERKKSADKVRVLEEKIERLNVDQSNISKQMKNIQEIISKVDNAKSTKVVEGALEELYSKYQTLSDNMLKHLEELQLKLLYIQNEK